MKFTEIWNELRWQIRALYASVVTRIQYEYHRWRRQTLVGTQCRWCDAWILKNVWHAPVPLCQACWDFQHNCLPAHITIFADVFNYEVTMLMQREMAGHTAQEINRDLEQEVAEKVAVEDERLLTYQRRLAIEQSELRPNRALIAQLKANIAKELMHVSKERDEQMRLKKVIDGEHAYRAQGTAVGHSKAGAQ